MDRTLQRRSDTAGRSEEHGLHGFDPPSSHQAAVGDEPPPPERLRARDLLASRETRPAAREADLVTPNGTLPQDFAPLTAVTQTVAGATTPGDRVSFTVDIRDDAVNEPIETYVVDLGNLRIAGASPADGSDFADSRGLGSIVDDDLCGHQADPVGRLRTAS